MDKERKAIIKNSDMTEDMQQDAINVATKAIDSYNIEKDIACYIKKEFDRKHNPTWHCIVGRNFGSYVTHETKHFIYFYHSFQKISDLCVKTFWYRRKMNHLFVDKWPVLNKEIPRWIARDSF